MIGPSCSAITVNCKPWPVAARSASSHASVASRVSSSARIRVDSPHTNDVANGSLISGDQASCFSGGPSGECALDGRAPSDPAGAGSGPTDGGGGSDVVAPGRFVVRFLNRPISEMLQRLSDGRNGPGRPSPTEVRHPSQHSFVAPPVAGCTVPTASQRPDTANANISTHHSTHDWSARCSRSNQPRREESSIGYQTSGSGWSQSVSSATSSSTHRM